mgnify:CR=1 FL=1
MECGDIHLECKKHNSCFRAVSSANDKLEKDENGNAVVRAIPYTKDAKGNMIYSSSEKLIVIDGIEDFIVVDKDNVLMIYPKNKEQNIKNLLTEISQNFGENYT